MRLVPHAAGAAESGAGRAIGVVVLLVGNDAEATRDEEREPLHYVRRHDAHRGEEAGADRSRVIRDGRALDAYGRCGAHETAHLEQRGEARALGAVVAVEAAGGDATADRER